jgi:Rrf2 family iron-sulfur cluster assembly transcriptional regulator
MFLTTRARYSISAMIEISDCYISGIERVNLAYISQKHNISSSYLEQLFLQLKKASLINSVKGPGGGYYLTKKPSEILLSEIVQAIGENIKMTQCETKTEGCRLQSKCNTHGLWDSLGVYIYRFFSSVSLQDIIDNKIVIK